MDSFVDDLFDTPRMQDLLDLQETLQIGSSSQTIKKPVNAKMCDAYAKDSLQDMSDRSYQHLAYFSKFVGYSPETKDALKKGSQLDHDSIDFSLPNYSLFPEPYC